MTYEITLGDEVLDSREILTRIEELEEEREDLVEGLDGTEEAVKELADWDAEYELELANWKILADQCEGYGDWKYGETLIARCYWKKYCQELAEDIGAIPKDVAWPCTCIDWDQACKELEMDYMEVEAGGFGYLMRA